MEKKIINTPIRYQGSKKLMLHKYRIHEFIPPINHDHPYCELFCGSAIMFFNLEFQYTHAFINDVNSYLINFWIQIREHLKAFEKRLEYVWCGDSNVDWQLDLDDPLDKAVQFYLEQANSSNHISKPALLKKDLYEWSNLLNRARVIIDQNPFEKELDKLMKLYTLNDPKRPCTIRVYEDPPYFGQETVYKTYYKGQKTKIDLPPFDHQLLWDKNQELHEKGHFVLLSYNKCPEILRMYKDWYIEEFEYSPNGFGANKATNRTELLISNYPLKRYTQQLKQTKIGDF